MNALKLQSYKTISHFCIANVSLGQDDVHARNFAGENNHRSSKLEQMYIKRGIKQGLNGKLEEIFSKGMKNKKNELTKKKKRKERG